MKRIIIALVIVVWSVGAMAQGTTTIGATRTTDTTLIKSQLKFTSLATADTNKVLGINSNGQIILRIKGGGGATTDSAVYATVSRLADTMRRDSLQTVLARGKNSTISMRFGSGANTVNTIVDSSTILVGLSTGNYSQVNQTSFRALTAGASSYDYKSDGIMKTDRTSLRTTTLTLPSSASGNKSIAFQDANGTVALLTDIPDTTRYLLKSDTTSLLITQADLNNHDATNVKLGGQIVGTRMIVGTTDSQDYVNKCFNRNDTIRTSDGLHTYEGKTNEIIARYFNFHGGTGVRNTKGVLIGTSITTEGQNYPYIAFGSSYTTSTPRITETGLFGYSLFNLYGSTTAGTIIKPAFQGTNTGDALTLALGSYTIANNSPTASGIMSMFKVGTGYLSTGRWTPSSGSATLNMLIGSVYVGATGTYTGNVVWATDDSVNLVGLGSGGTYFGYRATKNSGWGFFQNNSGAKNAFAGRTLVGTTTDNTVDGAQFACDIALVNAGNKIKIATGSNASVNGDTFSGGAVTVNNTAVTASSRIFIQYTSCSNCGTTYITAKVAGTSFTVTSSNALDASTFDYWIIN